MAVFTEKVTFFNALEFAWSITVAILLLDKENLMYQGFQSRLVRRF